MSFNTHEISASTVDASSKPSQRLEVFIATGRPRQLINNLSAISHLIDGYVTTNGAYCYAGDNNIVCNPLPEADALSIKAEADRMGAMLLVVALTEYCCATPTYLWSTDCRNCSTFRRFPWATTSRRCCGTA